MGFQPADVEPFAKDILKLDGVTGVWLLTPSDHRCTLWVSVRGLDETAYQWRMNVMNYIEAYIAAQGDMRENDFLFDYDLAVDEPSIGPPLIPPSAQPIGVAT